MPPEPVGTVPDAVRLPVNAIGGPPNPVEEQSNAVGTLPDVVVTSINGSSRSSTCLIKRGTGTRTAL